MRRINGLMLGVLAVPTLAFAQVGPNPAVPGGSQSPSVGGSDDAMTAPQDVRIGDRATGNVLDRTIDTRADADFDTDVDRAGPATGATGATIGAETRTTAGTKPMKTRRR